jgi:hypothetical protein
MMSSKQVPADSVSAHEAVVAAAGVADVAMEPAAAVHGDRPTENASRC